MEYDKDIAVEVKKQVAILAIEHLKKVDARTLAILQKNDIFTSIDPDEKYEGLLPILANRDHPDRRSIGPGPLFCYLAKKDPPGVAMLNMTEVLFAKDIVLRKAALDYFSNLEDGEISILTAKSRGFLKTLGGALLSDDKQKWRDAAVAVYDTLEEDWYCDYAGLRQSLHRKFVPGIEHYLTKVIRPTIRSVESVTPGVWEASRQKDDMKKTLHEIVSGNSDISLALNEYLIRFGHIPLASDLSIVSLIDGWQSEHGNIENIWDTLWSWADSFKLPLPRYHVCLYFVSNPSLVPDKKHEDLWHEIAEIVFLPNDEEAEYEWTPFWKMFCDIAKHYCCHLETRLPYKNGEIIASQAWWLAFQVCRAFTSEKEQVKRLRKETFLPELSNSSKIWHIASPCIQPSSLRHLTLNTQSIFALSLQSVLGNNIESLKPDSINKEDFKNIQNALVGAVLTVYPTAVQSDSEEVYAFDQSPLIMAQKWGAYAGKDDIQKDMINAFIKGTEKLMKSENLSDLLEKFTDSHSGDQILIATYLRNKVFTEDISIDEIWNAVDDVNWREAAFSKSHPSILGLLFETLNEIQTRYQDKWSYNLPHFYALECEKCEDEERKEYLFACVINSSLCGSTVSGIQRLLKSEDKHSYQDYVKRWRSRLEETQKWAPEWVKAQIRPVLAVLYI